MDKRISLLLLLVFTGSMAGKPAISADSRTIDADIWVDNWFALYVGEQMVMEDSIPITTERSFNKESFSFETTLPAQLNLIVKDFKENDTGLEYIGSRRQQMGDGGLIAQFKDRSTGKTLLLTNTEFRCLVTHKAPLNKRCEKSRNPEIDCESQTIPEPAGWMAADFDDSSWPIATVHSKGAVSPKHGYDEVNWDDAAKFIWGSDLETDNTLLCRATING